jgi:hypothetical protein
MAQGWRGPYTRYKGFFLNIVDLYKNRADLRAFLEVILSLTTIIIFVSFALRPTVLTILSLLQQIEEKEQTLASLELKNNNLNTATNILSQNQSRISDIDLAVSTSPSPQIISKQVLGLAGKNSVSILGLSLGQATLRGVDTSAKSITDFRPIQNAGGEMTISISLRGDYPSIRAFVKDLENLRIAVKTDILAINSSTTEAGQVVVGVITGRLPYTGTETQPVEVQ